MGSGNVKSWLFRDICFWQSSSYIKMGLLHINTRGPGSAVICSSGAWEEGGQAVDFREGSSNTAAMSVPCLCFMSPFASCPPT